MFTSSESIEKGLMWNPKPLSSSNVVALFVLQGAPQYASMWMKNTPTALDMIFIRDDLTVAFIHRNARPFDEHLIKSPERVAYVIEALVGYVDQQKIAIGDRVQFSSARSFTVS